MTVKWLTLYKLVDHKASSNLVQHPANRTIQTIQNAGQCRSTNHSLTLSAPKALFIANTNRFFLYKKAMFNQSFSISDTNMVHTPAQNSLSWCHFYAVYATLQSWELQNIYIISFSKTVKKLKYSIYGGSILLCYLYYY